MYKQIDRLINREQESKTEGQIHRQMLEILANKQIDREIKRQIDK